MVENFHCFLGLQYFRYFRHLVGFLTWCCLKIEIRPSIGHQGGSRVYREPGAAWAWLASFLVPGGLGPGIVGCRQLDELARAACQLPDLVSCLLGTYV